MNLIDWLNSRTWQELTAAIFIYIVVSTVLMELIKRGRSLRRDADMMEIKKTLVDSLAVLQQVLDAALGSPGPEPTREEGRKYRDPELSGNELFNKTRSPRRDVPLNKR